MSVCQPDQDQKDAKGIGITTVGKKSNLKAKLRVVSLFSSQPVFHRVNFSRIGGFLATALPSSAADEVSGAADDEQCCC